MGAAGLSAQQVKLQAMPEGIRSSPLSHARCDYQSVSHHGQQGSWQNTPQCLGGCPVPAQAPRGHFPEQVALRINRRGSPTTPLCSPSTPVASSWSLPLCPPFASSVSGPLPPGCSSSGLWPALFTSPSRVACFEGSSRLWAHLTHAWELLSSTQWAWGVAGAGL